MDRTTRVTHEARRGWTPDRDSTKLGLVCAYECQFVQQLESSLIFLYHLSVHRAALPR